MILTGFLLPIFKKGLRTIDKKTVKHTLRMTEKESQKLQRWADRAGLSKAEYVRQKVFGQEPQPMPAPAFWNHLAELSAIHDQIHNIALRQQMQRPVSYTHLTLPTMAVV